MEKPKPPPPKTKRPTAADAALFRNAVGDARALPDPGRTPAPPPYVKPIPRQRQIGDPPAHDLLTDHVAGDDSAPGDALSFQRPGVPAQTMRRLRRGFWPIQDELDLHGLNRDQARTQLVAFLHDCGQRNRRCVRIIHGKGLSSKNNAPVLKHLVKSWLMQREDVLAFVQAPDAEGGGGAVVVLLKRGK